MVYRADERQGQGRHVRQQLSMKARRENVKTLLRKQLDNSFDAGDAELKD
jgi:hypothetical protein